ncbi:hypothetical protein M5K25_020381 [Dendrobium thyrsiflorum]|uniref:Uncharacterized protein n=1 Tax=Dendrobium thyrsiflorum TaxID=117978 RepID=A0ABD0UGS6_DENTH
MSPNQGLKALLEGSNRNSDYQTVSKFDNLIVESSGSTRRVQRAQERRNTTSLSQKIVHRTVYDQGIQYRPSSQSLKRPRERSKTALAPLLLLDHRRSTAGPPPKGPTARRPAQGLTFYLRLDVLLKAGLAAQGQTSCSRPDALLKARRSAQGQTSSSRPDVLLKARRSAKARLGAQGQMSYSRPDLLLKARLATQGQTSCSRPDVLLKARHSAQGQTSCSRPYILLKARRSTQDQTSCSRADVLLKARYSI